MSDLNAIQQASQKLQPLISMITGGSQQAQGPGQGNVPMPMISDSSGSVNQGASYFRSLESLLHANAPQSDQIVRGAAGGYSTGATNRASARDGDPGAKVQDLAVGLGLFNPRTFMRGRDGDSGGQQQGQDPRGQSSAAAAQAVNLVQILQAQGLMQQQQTGLQGYLTPLNKDGVQFAGMTPKDMANTFNELMKELGDRLATELNGMAEQAPVESQNPIDMLAQVPNALTADSPDTKTIVQRLEDAIALRLLTANQDMERENQSNGVVEAAGLVLKTLVGKLQTGEIEPSPQVMETIVEALEGIVALNPELMNSGIGQRLNTMRAMLAAMKAQNAGGQGAEMANNAPLESAGWQVGADQESDSAAPTPLLQPKSYDTLASGNLDSSGIMRGVGFEGDAHDTFQYQLQPGSDGMLNILSANQDGGKGFALRGKMNMDDSGRPTGMIEGNVLWNGGREGIRLNSEGVGEFTNDGGTNWRALPNGEKSRYSSPDGRYSVQFNPVDRSVQFQEKAPEGIRLGAATLQADGEAVTVANITLNARGNIG